MGLRDRDEYDGRSRRRRHYSTHSPLGKNDWNAAGDSGRYLVRHSMPYRDDGEYRDIERQERRIVTSSRPRQSHASSIARSRSSVIMATPGENMSLSARSYASGHYERGRVPFGHELDHASGTDSRRSSRRGRTPVSPHYHASTPVSKSSSRTSITESDGETAESQSTQEEDDKYGRGSLEEIRVTAEGRRHRRPFREIVRDDHSEEEEDEDEDEDEDSEPEEYTEPSVDSDRGLETIRESDCAREEILVVPSPSPPRRALSPRRERRSQESFTLVDERPFQRAHRRPPRKFYEPEVIHVNRDRIDHRPSPRKTLTPRASGSHAPSNDSTPSRRASIVEKILLRPGRSPERRTRAIKQAQCLVCQEDLPSAKTAKLKCGHRMCNSCLKRSFKLSVTDPQLMPPRCCTSDHIPLKHVDSLFDVKFKKHWNRKFVEYSTRNRLYCPYRKCGAWIKPENIRRDRDSGRKYGRCDSCDRRACAACHGKWHSSRRCPSDEATNQILEQAQEYGWQRCYRCRNMVELKEGCNHMTCRCGAQFCMVCGDKWKSCDCPWFTYDSIETDELEMDPYPHPPLSLRTGRYPSPASPPRDYRLSEPPPAEHMLRPRPPKLEDEQRLRDLVEQRDRNLAKRFELREEGDDDDSEYMERSTSSDSKRLPTADEYRRGRGILPPPPPTGPSPFDRASRTDYISDVSKARGVPETSSFDKRLADRFSAKRAAQSSPSMGMPLHMMPMGGQSPLSPANPYRTLMTGPPPLMRRHTAGDDIYGSPMVMTGPRAAERMIPGRMRHDYAAEAAVHAPARHRRSEVKSSSLAGLSGQGRGMNRVFEWRNHVEPGVPDGDAAA